MILFTVLALYNVFTLLVSKFIYIFLKMHLYLKQNCFLKQKKYEAQALHFNDTSIQFVKFNV